MAKKMRKTQEEEIIQVLKKEGFKELNERDLQKEPYKSIYALPSCFAKEKNSKLETHKNP
jgi:hypothetical protein